MRADRRDYIRPLWVWIGAYTITWGLWIANPWWNVFSQAALYSRMGGYMPEWMWGTNAILAGAATIYGALHPSRRGLVWGTAAHVYHWGVVGILYLVGDWRNTGGLVSLATAGCILLLWDAWDKMTTTERRRDRRSERSWHFPR